MESMLSKRAWTRISVIYDNVNFALWALLITFMIYFAFFVVPQIPQIHSHTQGQRLLQIAAEHEFYCSKWGMTAHSPAHEACILDLQAFRLRVEMRANQERELW